MTLAEAKELVRRLELEEAEKLQTRAAQRQLEADAEAATKAAEDARLKAAWWENQKLSRLRAIVPLNNPTSHVQFGGIGRQWINHLGQVMIGTEIIPTELEDGVRVVYIHLHDFKTLASSERNGLDWERANPTLMQKLAEIAPKAGASAGPI